MNMTLYRKSLTHTLLTDYLEVVFFNCSCCYCYYFFTNKDTETKYIELVQYWLAKIVSVYLK